MAKQYGMVVDTTRCMGCQTCVVTCKISNEVPGDIYWGHLLNRDNEDASPYQPVGTYPKVTMNFRPTLCNHCAEPACVETCPTGAMHKREDNGAVVVDQEVCIGCGTCVKACPYEVPQLDSENSVSSKCTMCFDRQDNDHKPWCVQSCPAEARIVGDLNDPESEVSKYIAEKGAKPYLEENGTTPSVYYV